jgi:uncharacterized protein YjbI with pentapeptide repeats
VTVAATDEQKRAALRQGQALHFSHHAGEKERTIQANWIRELATTAENKFHVPIDIRNAIIEGELKLHNATFEGGFCIVGSWFKSDVDFSFSTFGRSANFMASSFQKADFTGAHIANDADFRGAQFAGKAGFDRLQLAGGAFFGTYDNGQRTQFGDDATFYDARIGANTDFNGAVFLGKAGFDRVHIEGNAFFSTDGHNNRVSFGGTVTWCDAQIEGPADFRGAQFAQGAYFDRIHVNGEAIFHADGDDTRPQAIHNPTVFSGDTRFDNAHFEHGCSFKSAQFAQSASFISAVTERKASFVGAVFGGLANFSDAKFSITRFRAELIRKAPLGEPQFHGRTDVRGFTYDRFYGAWEEVLTRTVVYDRQPFTQMEKVLRTSGLDEEADAVYYEQRRREGNLIPLKRLHSRLWDWAYRLLAGYGVRGWRLLVIFLLLLLAGSFVFHRDGALIKKAEAKSGVSAKVESSPEVVHGVRAIDAFCVSLRLLVRLEIPTGSSLSPSENSLAQRIPMRYSMYATVHMIAGWLLLPFVAASIAKRFGRRGGSE